jgi:hypothetical protein
LIWARLTGWKIREPDKVEDRLKVSGIEFLFHFFEASAGIPLDKQMNSLLAKRFTEV